MVSIIKVSALLHSPIAALSPSLPRPVRSISQPISKDAHFAATGNSLRRSPEGKCIQCINNVRKSKRATPAFEC